MNALRSSRLVSATVYATFGAAWGGLAWLFGHKAFGPAVVGGLVASPVVGVIVGFTLQAWYERASRWARIGIAWLSMYLGVVLFGVAVGIADATAVGTFGGFAESLLEGVVAAAYGVTITFYFLMFWPLAYFTHRALAAMREVPLTD